MLFMMMELKACYDMSKVAVSQGEQVCPGSLLGETGGAPGTPGAGPSTGPHLHFEYYPNSSSGPVDGSPFAASMFSLGGTLTPTAPQTPVTPTTPTAVATAATPNLQQQLHDLTTQKPQNLLFFLRHNQIKHHQHNLTTQVTVALISQ